QLAPCERVQSPLLDLVHQFPRLASRWYEIKPPARRHAVVSQAEDMASDRVAMVMVVEKPAVNLASPQFRLNGFDVRHDGYGVDSKSAATCARVTPEMDTRLARLFSPATILTAETGTFKRSANSRRSASFARSSTGGAVSRIFSAPLYSPSIAFRLARGATRTANTTSPSRTCIST